MKKQWKLAISLWAVVLTAGGLLAAGVSNGAKNSRAKSTAAFMVPRLNWEPDTMPRAVSADEAERISGTDASIESRAWLGDRQAQRVIAGRRAYYGRRIDPIEACAWRLVVASDSRSPELLGDTLTRRIMCGRLSVIDSVKAVAMADEFLTRMRWEGPSR